MTNLQKSDQEFQKQFNEILIAINNAKSRVYSNINKELISLYWDIGKYISDKVEKKLWGKSIVENLANYIYQKQPHLKGYSKQNLWRMKQFYETYKDYEFLSTVSREIKKTAEDKALAVRNKELPPLLVEISWSHNTEIFSRCKVEEEREFYIRLCIKERLSFRELQRQINTSSFERVMTADDGLSPALKTIVKSKGKDNAISTFKDTYILDFLDDLPREHKEKDLQKALVNGLKEFILEIGKDFSFVGQNYKLEVGDSDFYVDLLFYHRELQCLVCFELKTEKFKPEHLGQLNFYLEALDRDVKKEHEKPSIGILLCDEKDNEVVKYAMSCTLSPTMIADYKTKLIPKKILQDKMHELLSSFEKGKNKTD
jgi:predicted nuclease of restriction endonuclease-like (RecB) superfamily